MKKYPRYFLLAISVVLWGASASSATAELTVSPDALFTWDGVSGPPLPNPSPNPVVPDNLATDAGATAFAIDTGHNPPHAIPGLNNGLYGNSNSWIGIATRPIDVGGGTVVDTTFAGIDFADSDLHNVTSFAFGRSNIENEFADRHLGTYYVQLADEPDPDVSTPDSSWRTIGSITIDAPDEHRHLYLLATTEQAYGIRIVTPGPGTCIDEIEIFSSDTIRALRAAEDGGEIEAANNLAASGSAFAKDALAGRAIASLNDQTIGDGSAWIGASPDSFAGVSLGAAPVLVRSIAFGRDNTGVQTDRSLGEYTVQATNVADPDETTPDADWAIIGTITYEAGDPADPHLRHRFNFATVMATGIRLLTPDGAAIDELEVYEDAYVPPPPPALTITPAGGFSATWDGNDGDHFDENPPPDGAVVPDNLALASNGATAFATNPISPHAPTHVVEHLNDGFYGNSNSHINGDGPSPGHMVIALPGTTALTAIAWGRDNGNGAFDDSVAGSDACGGQCDDRSIGIYTLQFTNVDAPNAATPDEDWTTIAEFNYTNAAGTDNETGGLFTEWLRHQYEIGVDGGGPVVATGVRIIVPDTGIAIDEIELYGSVSTAPFVITDFSYDSATDEVSITFNSQPGKFYALDASGDLQSWGEIDDGIESIGTSTTVISSATPGSARQYFRIREF